MLQAIKVVAKTQALQLDIREDRHFFTTMREFAAHAKNRKSLRMEYFYRAQRKQHRVLMTDGGPGEAEPEPLGGQWNFDADNREAFDAAGPGAVPPRAHFESDNTTREVVAAAVVAHDAGRAPLASVEGFVRQILGWREYVRGIYWTQMPAYAQLNTLAATQDLPACYGTGDTDMACLRDALTQTLAHGYANHIQRLMVTGLYALMLGV